MNHLPERLFWSASTYLKAKAEKRLPYRSQESLQAIQDRRVRNMVAHAYSTVPHYREAMDDLGLSPGEMVTADSLAQLPLIDGAELAASPERFYSNRYTNAGTLTLNSSGTNGRAKAVRYNKAALFEALAHGHRQREVMTHFTGKPAGYREMGIRRLNSIATQLRQFFESHAWVPPRMDLQRSALSLELPFDEMVRRINEFKPEVLAGYGSHLGALFRWAWEGGLNLHRPKVLWYGADAMPQADRMLIENEMGVPVFSTYQADEALRIGFQCERRQGFHLSLDDVAVRVIKPDGSPAGPGEQGELVISNLSNRATVLLNYRLGDVVGMPEAACGCGRTLPMIEAVRGRADDMILMSNGESRHALLFMAPMQEIPGVVQVQLVQEKECQLSIKVVCAAGSEWPMIKKSTEQIVLNLTGQTMKVDSHRVTVISREPGGKVRAVISKLRQQNAR
jgi:phenylacetate-CoA ligase